MTEYVTGGRKAAGTGEEPRSALQGESEGLLDNPLHGQALARLSRRELFRYRKARALLDGGGDALALLKGDMAMRGLGVYEALLARSWAVRFADPILMIYFASVADHVAGRFDPRGHGRKRVADLQARALGELANAYRVADDLQSAREHFGRAYARSQEGTGDPYLRARLLDLEASLLGTKREFGLALVRLKVLFRIYRDLGERHLAGRTLITCALYTSYSGFTEQAQGFNGMGLSLIDRRRDPLLSKAATHNHLLFLVDLGRFAQAKRFLFENRTFLVERGQITDLKLRWVEGRISYGMGELVSAEIAFTETRSGLSGAGMSFHESLLALELAAVYLKQDRVEEAEREVIVAREIFRAVEVYREFLGSVIFLEECFRRREITADIIDATVKYLRWREHTVPARPRG